MTHQVWVRFLAVAGCLWLAACTPPAASEEAEQAPVSKQETKPEPDPASTAGRGAADLGGIRPPKDLYKLPQDRELKATNPSAGEKPPSGGVIVNPPGQAKE